MPAATQAGPVSGTRSTVATFRDLWILAALAMALLYVLEIATQSGGEALVRRFAVLADLPLGIGASLASALAARHCAARSPTRRAWTILAFAQAAFVLGSLSWAWLQEVRHAHPFPSAADAFYIAFYVTAFASVVAFSAIVPMRTRRLAFALDGAIFVAAAGALVWALLIVPFLERPGANVAKGLISIAYACGSGLLVFGMGALLLRGGTQGRPLPLRVLALAFAVLFCADLTWLLAELDGRFQPGGWPDALYVVSQAIQIAAARLQMLTTTDAGTTGRGRSTSHSTGFVSLFTMLMTGAFVLWLRRDRIGSEEAVLLAAMIIASALAGLRQLVSAREVARIEVRATRQEAERRFAAIFEQSSDVIVITDREGRIQYATASITRVLGYAPGELVRMHAGSFLHPDDDAAGQAFFDGTLRTRGVSAPGEWRLRARDGGYRYLESVAVNLIDDPAVAGVVITLRDVTERRALQDRLNELAFTDGLTLLGNRSRFRETVAHALADPELARAPFAILFVDLDDFKRVNDGLGHHKGDDLLRVVAERLRSAVPDGADVARLGGDEFAVLLPGCDAPCAQAIADAVIEALTVPLPVGATTLTIGASVGIAVAAPGQDADDVLRHADIAMYEAKRHGKGRSASFEPVMQVRANQRLDLEERLREAIASGRIGLHYQPVIDMRTGDMTGAEVLARWEDSVHGSIPAGEFIALAEESAQIVALGRHVLLAACRQIGQWRAQQPLLPPFSIAVNVSARQLDDGNFFELVEGALAESGMAADKLVLELTESAMLHPRPQLRASLERLRGTGIRLALDDFGAGYSSLNYLHRFPFDVLKIDKALVERVGYSADGTALVRAVLSVAEALHLAVVAEGIEDTLQRDELLRIGCRLGQGFLLARPMPAPQFLDWLARRHAPAAVPAAQ